MVHEKYEKKTNKQLGILTIHLGIAYNQTP